MTRQWQILRDIDAARTGITIPKLAAARGVHQRTIRRDIDALSNAGFPLYDEKVNGTTMWKLRSRPFRGLEEGLSVMELCALYFSRAMLASLAGAPYQDEVERAFAKIERALPASCRKFLDGLPVAIKAKFAGRKKTDDRKVRDVVIRATEAMMNHRRVTMRYDSAASRRTKEYVVEPLRMSYADGGTYLTAFVPEYGEMRNFAVERIRALAVTDETFAPRPLPAEPFANSIGVYSGTPERVELEFDASIADYVASREWHKTQTFEVRPDGSFVMRLDVCVDVPLRAWILSFGAAVRVVAPERLTAEILDQLEQVRTRYMPRLKFQMLSMAPAASASNRTRTSHPQENSRQARVRERRRRA
jgi:proteasome accessory factor B